MAAFASPREEVQPGMVLVRARQERELFERMAAFASPREGVQPGMVLVRASNCVPIMFPFGASPGLVLDGARLRALELAPGRRGHTCGGRAGAHRYRPRACVMAR